MVTFKFRTQDPDIHTIVLAFFLASSGSAYSEYESAHAEQKICFSWALYVHPFAITTRLKEGLGHCRSLK